MKVMVIVLIKAMVTHHLVIWGFMWNYVLKKIVQKSRYLALMFTTVMIIAMVWKFGIDVPFQMADLIHIKQHHMCTVVVITHTVAGEGAKLLP